MMRPTLFWRNIEEITIRRLLVIGVAGTLLLLGGMAAVARTQPAAAGNESADEVLGSIPPAARAALVAGEPEYALRLLLEDLEKSTENLENVDDAIERDHYRAVFEYALDLRLREHAEGAVVDLLLNAPVWLGAERANGARRLAADWKEDNDPTLRSLTRRLNWYRALQRSIRPAPIDVEMPITLTLIALDHVDHVDHPMDTVLLLEIADEVAPNHVLWSSYRPNEQYLTRAADQMVREQNFLATGEIYRRLIYLSAGNADWFKRRYANNQLARVYALFGVVGADYASQAAARVRQGDLEASELGRFRLLKENLRELIVRNTETRRLPRTLEGDLNLEALPLGYLIQDRMVIEKGGSLNFGPGSVVRGGGRVVLSGGRVQFNGTADEPVIVVGLTFESDDVSGGGVIEGSHVQFRDCSFRRDPVKPTVPGALRWRFSSTYANGCRFPFDPHVDVEWSRSEFDESDITLPIQTARFAAPAKADSTEAANDNSTTPIPGAYVVLADCVFKDCRIDDALAVRAGNSRFVDCQIKSWSPVSLPATVANGTTVVVNNLFVPHGEIPAQISRQSVLGTQIGLIVFAGNAGRTAQELDLGKVRLWVE